MKKLPPTARLIYTLIESAATPIHAGDILPPCSITCLKASLSLLSHAGLIERVNLGNGPCYRPSVTCEVASGN